MRFKKLVSFFYWENPENNLWGFYKNRPVPLMCLKCGNPLISVEVFVKAPPKTIDTPYENTCKRCHRWIEKRKRKVDAEVFHLIYHMRDRELNRIKKLHTRSKRNKNMIWDVIYLNKKR